MTDAAAGGRVLVVDDDPLILEVLRTILQLRELEVACAGDGAAALEQLERDPLPDVIVCDVMMPGLDGVQTLERLREAAPRMKVIMATAYATPQTAVKSKKLGAFNYLAKPYEMNDLLDVVERALREGREQAS